MKLNRRIKSVLLGGFVTGVIGLGFVGSAAADIYLYIDAQGILHFTNVPTSSKYQVYLKEKPVAPILSYADARFDRHIKTASTAHRISIPLLTSVIRVESNFNPRAVSKAGAMGLMQIMPQTVEKLDLKNPFDPRENIMAGARYLRRLLNRFDQDLTLALAAYHAGPTTVARYNDIPPIRATQAYVKKVMKYYYMYKKR